MQHHSMTKLANRSHPKLPFKVCTLSYRQALFCPGFYHRDVSVSLRLTRRGQINLRDSRVYLQVLGQRVELTLGFEVVTSPSFVIVLGDDADGLPYGLFRQLLVRLMRLQPR